MIKNYLYRFRWLLLIIIAYLLLAFGYSIAVPLAETPDESEHFLYLQHIALERALPVMSPVREENDTLEGHQPPLLYLAGAALTAGIEMDTADNLPPNPCFSFEPDDAGRQHAYLHRPQEWPPQRGVYQVFQLMRWLSVLMGAATVALAYVLGRQLYPTGERVALVAAALLAFNPQFIFITASLNNDVPTTLLGAAIVALSIKAAQRPRRRYFAGLGILVGLGILTKFALLAFWPLALLAVAVGARRARRLSFLVPRLVAVILLPVLIAGWWYWRAYLLYGDPLMWDVTLAAKGTVVGREGALALSDLGEFILLHFQSYWLWFGWLNVKAPPVVYGLLAVAVATAVVGLLVLARKRRLPLNATALLFNILAILAIYASLWRYIQTINWTGYQGRLAFAAAAPIALVLALGLVSLGGGRLGQVVGGGLLALSALAIPLTILPAYPRPQIYQPPPDLARTCARFASGLQVEAIDVAPQTKPGQTLQATVYGYGLHTPGEPQQVALQLVGREGEVVGQVAAPLRWQAGEVVSATLALPVAASALPARAEVAVGMRTPAGAWQTATSATGRVLQIPLGVQTVKIAPQRPFIPTPQQTTAANFGDQLALVGYDLVQDGRRVTVTLYWQALASMSHNYTTFIHVLDERGELLTQSDGQPQQGGYPTAIWDVGEIVADAKTVTLPGDDGRYQLVAGVYLLATGQRLPLVGEQAGDTFLLPVPPEQLSSH